MSQGFVGLLDVSASAGFITATRISITWQSVNRVTITWSALTRSATTWISLAWQSVNRITATWHAAAVPVETSLQHGVFVPTNVDAFEFPFFDSIPQSIYYRLSCCPWLSV